MKLQISLGKGWGTIIFGGGNHGGANLKKRNKLASLEDSLASSKLQPTGQTRVDYVSHVCLKLMLNDATEMPARMSMNQQPNRLCVVSTWGRGGETALRVTLLSLERHECKYKYK